MSDPDRQPSEAAAFIDNSTAVVQPSAEGAAQPAQTNSPVVTAINITGSSMLSSPSLRTPSDVSPTARTAQEISLNGISPRSVVTSTDRKLSTVPRLASSTTSSLHSSSTLDHGRGSRRRLEEEVAGLAADVAAYRLALARNMAETEMLREEVQILRGFLFRRRFLGD